MGPPFARLFAPTLAIAAALLVACSAGEPSTATPDATVEATPAAEVTATPTPAAFPPTPTPRAFATPTPRAVPPTQEPAPQPFVLETRPSEVELRLAAPSASSDRNTSFIYDRVTDQLWQLSEPIAHWYPGNPNSAYVLGFQGHQQFSPVLLIDPGAATVEDLGFSASIGQVRWLSPTEIEVSLVPPNRSTASLYVLDLATLEAVPAEPRRLTPRAVPLDGATLEVRYDGTLSRLVTANGPTELGELGDAPSVSPDERRIIATRLGDGRVITAEAPDWTVRESELSGRQDRIVISWSGDSSFAAFAGSGAVWLIGPALTDTSLLISGTIGTPLAWVVERQLVLYHDVRAAVALDPASGVEIRFEEASWEAAAGNVGAQLRNRCNFDGLNFTLHAVDLTTGSEWELAPGNDGFALTDSGPNGLLRASTPGEVWFFDLASDSTTVLDASRGVGDYYVDGHWAGEGRWYVFGPALG